MLHRCSMIGRNTAGADGASISAVWSSSGLEPIAVTAGLPMRGCCKSRAPPRGISVMRTKIYLDERRRRLSRRGVGFQKARTRRSTCREGRRSLRRCVAREDLPQAVTALAAWLPGGPGWCRTGVARCSRSSVGRPGGLRLRVALTPVARRPSRRAEIAPGGTGSERGHTASGWCQAATRAPRPPVSGCRRDRPSCRTPPPRKPSPHSSPVAARHASSGRAGRSQWPRPRRAAVGCCF